MSRDFRFSRKMALNVIMNIQFFVNNRVIQLLVANRLLILSIYLSIYLSNSSSRKQTRFRGNQIHLPSLHLDVLRHSI